MEQYKQEFIEFMVESQVLKFGDFTLKSGRKSPFFMNAGAYVTGSQLRRLGEYYAKAIHDHFGLDFDVLFGPAYKGIPLAVAASMAISQLYGKDVRYCSNRKEVKDHGDAGILLGSKLKDGDRVMVIEDVTTSGKSIEETFPILKAQADVEIKGLIVSLNRMERGKAQYIVNAVLAYQNGAQAGDMPHAGQAVDYERIRQFVLQVIREHERQEAPHTDMAEGPARPDAAKGKGGSFFWV